MSAFYQTCVVVLFFMVTGCSSLTVTKYSENGSEQGGIPVYLPEQKFVITTLGKTNDGKEADIKPYQVTMVTDRDQGRKFMVSNHPGPFSNTSFSVTRDTDGTLLNLSGTSTGQGVETVQALAVFAGTISSLKTGKVNEPKDTPHEDNESEGNPPEDDVVFPQCIKLSELIDLRERCEQLVKEQNELTTVRSLLYNQLTENITLNRTTEAESIMSALQHANSRILEIDSIIAGMQPKDTVGVKASSTELAEIKVVNNEEERAAFLNARKINMNSGDPKFIVVLVPADN